MKKIIFFIIILISIAGVIFWLSSQKQEAVKYQGPIEEVNLKLKWYHQAQFAGNYVAKEKGFYKNQGLKVNILPFDKDYAIKSVSEGRDMFGIAGASEVILARAKGIPIKAIAVIYKINPIVAYSLKSSGITKPQDFIGKTIGIERASDGTDTDVGLLYYAMMSRLDLDRSKIKEVTIGHDATELLAGKTDVSTGYVINEPEQVRDALGDVNTIPMAEYGANMYADVIFATDETIRSKPGLVERFLRATLEGWQYAIENNKEAVEMTLKYANTSTVKHQAYMLEKSIPLISAMDSVIGWMNEEQWNQAQNISLNQKILQNRINIKDAYTMQFLEKIYK